ncbi:hypothetical protein EYF80_053190 [Liparis tanakae]|uniref:Uncharacterized protein n=1 Tax=Liparis tanakae TaxID=230148 RepID=A0A4Z2F774_9TELE|nr:hypothetical protein EYF80_053190 [Liparis tanakae]
MSRSSTESSMSSESEVLSLFDLLRYRPLAVNNGSYDTQTAVSRSSWCWALRAVASSESPAAWSAGVFPWWTHTRFSDSVMDAFKTIRNRSSVTLIRHLAPKTRSQSDGVRSVTSGPEHAGTREGEEQPVAIATQDSQESRGLCSEWEKPADAGRVEGLTAAQKNIRKALGGLEGAWCKSYKQRSGVKVNKQPKASTPQRVHGREGRAEEEDARPSLSKAPEAMVKPMTSMQPSSWRCGSKSRWSPVFPHGIVPAQYLEQHV